MPSPEQSFRYMLPCPVPTRTFAKVMGRELDKQAPAMFVVVTGPDDVIRDLHRKVFEAGLTGAERIMRDVLMSELTDQARAMASRMGDRMFDAMSHAARRGGSEGFE